RVEQSALDMDEKMSDIHIFSLPLPSPFASSSYMVPILMDKKQERAKRIWRGSEEVLCPSSFYGD
ncbi:MAG TPA: hypothetical protein PKE52_09190, partial [Bacteroidales bacterium]|nr:hypothetical protein [Bacteroidales bacterium]